MKVQVRDVRAAMAGLPDESPVTLQMLNDPDGLSVTLHQIDRDDDAVVLHVSIDSIDGHEADLQPIDCNLPRKEG